ncbi:PREDICTED: uncharacterized protein LOC104806295 [Tarenaya hassleriana]|uniref:uncharacterized protein LOC104806295 n=1 Tax=Tarenaya hassleriana TaxID=28532 RepID=UPI00053C9FFC|nr:PREDICTED: uncharacterized protein LOC104806295 [Tarenaya hassleriana]
MLKHLIRHFQSSSHQETPMAAASAAAPVAVGTRGTVGSLVRKEIDYFRTFDQRNCIPNGNFDSDNHLPTGRTKLSSWFSKTRWRRKKRRSSGDGFLPTMCSSAEVSGENRISGFSYRILKNDQKGYT